jgi:uncharacterized membrane protein
LLGSWVGAGLRWIPPLVLLWLGFVFGQSLRAGATPLIERIARRSNAALPAPLCRYTRRLTALWCAYFFIAAGLAAVAHRGYAAVSLALWAATALLFVGERWVRTWLFPDETFPGLWQQLRDTWSIWRSRH